jgi:hypothetical protein
MRAFAKGIQAAGLPAGPGDAAPVSEADLARLPGVAQRYLHAMGVVGQPRAWSFRARYTGWLRLRPAGPRMPMQVWQYNNGLSPARLLRMRLRLAGVLSMTGWDTYLHGRGRMHGKLLGLVSVANGNGPRFDVSELVSWLNDAVLFAPSMLLNSATTWTATSTDDTFDVAVTDAGHRVQARVTLDADGRPRRFSTTDRWAALPEGLVRAQWLTPVIGWQVADGRPVPTGGDAIWQLPDRPFHYAHIDIPTDGIDYNITPGDAGLQAKTSHVRSSTARVPEEGDEGS